MKLFGFGPAREVGHGVELPEELRDQLIGVILRAQLLEASEHARERGIGIDDRALGEILSLKRETLSMFEEFLTVEVGR